MQRPTRTFGLALRIERAGLRQRVGVGFEYGAQGRSLPVQVLDALEVGRHERAGGVLSRLEACLQLGDGHLLELEGRGYPRPGSTDPARKRGEPGAQCRYRAAHRGMLEKRAAVYRPIAHSDLLVE